MNTHPYVLRCSQCWEQIKDEPCGCGEPTPVEIDIVLDHTVTKLNKNGYFTRYCCQGSEGVEGSTYIAFEAGHFPHEILLCHRKNRGRYTIAKLQDGLISIESRHENLETQQNQLIELIDSIFTEET